MPTIDLATPTPTPPPPPLAAAPRRIGLTLPELERVAEAAGGAPLPFEVSAPAPVGAMESRLGATPATTENQAYRSALASMHDAEESLERRGLLVGGVLEEGLAGAVGLLATPGVALDLDLTQAGVQAKAWHRQAGRAVATLATVDGLVFELAWFGADAWPAELSRIAVLSEALPLSESAVPSYVDLPYELLDGATEAIRSGRGDLVPVLVGRHTGMVRGLDGGPLADAEVIRVLMALAAEAQGRLRGLVADVSAATLSVVGVVSWTLVADGWRALRPHRESGGLRVEIRSVAASELPTVVAPVLAEAAR